MSCVTLSELVQVAGPLRDNSLWALLQLVVRAVQAAAVRRNPAERHGLAITPDTILLHRGGRVALLTGAHHERKFRFSASEPEADGDQDLEKEYVYALAASIRAAFRDGGSKSPLSQLLADMLASEPASRLSLQSVASACARHTIQEAMTEVDALVELVFGTGHDVSSEDEECISGKSRPLQRSASSRSVGAPNLARLSTSSMPPAYHSSIQDGLNRREASLQSLHTPLSLSLQFQEIGYLASKSPRVPLPNPLPVDMSHSLRRAMSLSFDGRAAINSDSAERQNSPPHSKPPSPPHSPPPSSEHSSPPNSQTLTSPPSLPPSPPPNPPQDGTFSPVEEEQDITWCDNGSMALVSALNTDTFTNDFPALPPPPPPPPPPTSYQPHDEVVSQTPNPLASTAATLQTIDSLLEANTAMSTGQDGTPHSNVLDDDIQRSPVSFDYSDIERAPPGPPSTSSGEEFAFPLPPTVMTSSGCHPGSEEEVALEEKQHLDTQRAIDEALQNLDAHSNWEKTSEQSDDYVKEDEVRALYATVDMSKKSKKTKHLQRSDRPAEGSDSTELFTLPQSEDADMERPPLPPPLVVSDSEEHSRFSGIYEEVEPRPTTILDSSGYTEVRRATKSEPLGSVMSYSGNGSLYKLRNVLGPEFRNMTGEKMVPVTGGHLPEGRCVVEVVLLDGKKVEFIVCSSATTSDLFGQVTAYQSLIETHVFGLAVRNDRDDIFLEVGSKLAKHGPPGWARASNHTPFTVFFRVKYYVENVCQLSQRFTRHLFYLQLRQYHMEGKMFCHEDHTLRLAALALQAEKGSTVNLGHVRLEDYVPARVMEKLGRESVGSILSLLHLEIHGLSQSEAELEFLKEAQKLPEYGMLFYRVAKTKRGKIGAVWLGFCVRGLVVFDVHRDVKTAVQHCAWRKTTSISRSNKKLVIELHDHLEPLVFFTRTYKRAHYLLELSKACHKFHLVWARKSRDTTPAEPAATTAGQGDAQYIPPTGFSHNAAIIGNSQPPQDLAATEVIVEYPSLSRPTSVADVVSPPLPAGESVSVEMRKEAGVLGIRIAGGSDKPYGRGLIRVKQLTADTASSRSGILREGDIIRQVNTVSLRGMTHRQAANTILRAGDHVTLQLHRPSDSHWWQTSPSSGSLTESLNESIKFLPPPSSPLLLSTAPNLLPADQSSPTTDDGMILSQCPETSSICHSSLEPPPLPPSIPPPLLSSPPPDSTNEQ